MPSKTLTTIVELKTINNNKNTKESSKNLSNNKIATNNKNVKLVELATKQQNQQQQQQSKQINKSQQKMYDINNNNNNNNNKKGAPVITPNTKGKQFVPLKSATNANRDNDMIRGSMQRSKSNSDTKFNGANNNMKSLPNTPNNKNAAAKSGGKESRDMSRGQHVDMHQLDAMLLPNSKGKKANQDTYSLTHSIAKESWQQNYKECQRHQRLVKDDNLEKKCSSCNVLYVLCETCRHDRQVPFTDDDTCIDCAPSAYKVRGLIQKKDALIRELHYKASRMEDDVVKSQKELDQMRQRMDETEQLKVEMQDDYRKAVTDSMNKENENIELVQKLASAIKEIHQLQVHTQTHEELVKDLNELLISGDFADCQVQIGSTGERIALHKAILAARSEYFRSMINQPSTPVPPGKGGKNNNPASGSLAVITLDNISRENVNQVLEYVYCGKCKHINDDETAKELYELAKRLGLSSLKDIVVDYYVNKLSRENALQVASKTLYIQNSSEKYRDYIKNFILTECADVVEHSQSSAEWRRLKQENPSFVVELLENKIAKDEKKYKKYNSLRNIHEESGYHEATDPSVADTNETSLKSNFNNNNNLNNGSSGNFNKSGTPRKPITNK